MTLHDPQNLPPPVNDFLPTTFLERGIAVPFTTPMLAGARARPGERGAMELIVPNPSGGRGVYILPWQDISALCRPTVHDMQLSAAIATVQGVTPTTIRKAVRETAALGFAGRAAADAARAAEVTERTAKLMANFELLLALVRRVEPPGENPVPPEQERPAELERRARRAIARIAPEFGRTPDAIAIALEQLAALFSGVGLGKSAHTSRVPQLLGRLLQLRTELDTYLRTHSGATLQDAEFVAGGLDLTTTCARVVIADGALLATDVNVLIRTWILEPDTLSQTLARAEWLLDGWDRIVALWDTAESHLGQEATLAEMCKLVPAVPREIGKWVSHQLNIETDVQRHRRRILLGEDWRTGNNVMDLITRNEALLAQA